jgi:hypothetical protein
MTTGLKTKEIVEVVSISTPIKDKGICVTCSHAPSCVFLKASSRPTWFCEEFDEFTAAAASMQNASTTLASIHSGVHTNGNGNGNGNGGSAGLCSNCEVRTACVHRKPGAPVFECEEYQ